MHRSLLALPFSFGTLALLVSACGSGHIPAPNADLVAGTTIGDHRCKVGQTDDRPFVVEWDSTDLASFEAKAQRDIVFVKVAGCELKVLDCKDDGIGGKYGIYNAVAWTSGSVEGFEIKNEGDLYAKLPLGAVQLAGSVNAGNALHLKYFVSGSRPADRNIVYRGDLAGNPLCGDATHFVTGYDLGAFELDTSGHDSESASIGVGKIGGGGSLSHEQSHLKHAGQLDDCTADTAKELGRCKAPIRLALRAITEGNNPSPPQNTAITTPPDPGVQPGMSTAEQVTALMQSAVHKEQLRDGNGCLGDLDRATALDPKFESRGNMMMIRAQCEMLAGKCDQGKKRYRIAIVAAAPQLTPAQIDQAASYQASQLCGSNQGTPAEKAQRAGQDYYKANEGDDGPGCEAAAKVIAEQIPKMPTDDKDAKRAKSRAELELKSAVNCMARLSTDCPTATKLYSVYVSAMYADRPQTTIDAINKAFKCPGHNL
jgi:hypothetical protein